MMPPFADLIAMWLLGFLGTGHCIGMCGPLVVAFPAQTGKISAHLFYHSGRIFMYAAVGATMGAASGVFLNLTATARIQVIFSVVAALFLIWFGLVRLRVFREPRFMSGVSPHRFWGFRIAADAARRGNSLAQLPIGFAMGLIPCGLSYAAFARAVPTGSGINGALLLFAFGLGTLPGLFLLGTVFSKIFSRHRPVLDIFAALVMFGMGVKLVIDAIV